LPPAEREALASTARLMAFPSPPNRSMSPETSYTGPASVYQPRMQDLRYTFAVHRLTAWFKHGADMGRMIPALSTYMGQHDLSASERYLRLTPERFRAQLNKLSPKRGKRRWRDDAELMKFLDNLQRGL